MIIIKYEIIIFDADETLFDFKKSEKKAFENIIIDFGIMYDENYHYEWSQCSSRQQNKKIR